MAGLVNFEDEKEVKQFLDNLGMEYHYQCYFEKDPDGCQRLADYLENIIKNNALAARVLKYNYEVNEQSESCYKLGGYYATGKGGVTECLKTAYSCFIKACDAKEKRSAGACHFAGLLAYDGRALGGTRDPVVARQYYEKACEGGFAPSCFHLSGFYIQGLAGVDKNMPLALKYSTQACELGHAFGCINASIMYKRGDGTKRDDCKAEKLEKRARELLAQEKEALEISDMLKVKAVEG